MKRYVNVLAAFPLLLLTACVPYYVDYSGYYEPTPWYRRPPLPLS
jgi:hypothetical protein